MPEIPASNDEVTTLSANSDLREAIRVHERIHGPSPLFAELLRENPVWSRPGVHRAIRRDGEIAALSSLAPWDQRFGETTLKVGEIGLVGTVPEHRNRGLSRALMEALFDIMQAEGYALAKTYRPNTAYQDELDDAEEVAITEGRGMWLACDGSVSLDPTLEADGEPDADRIDRTLTPVTEDEDAVCSFFDTFDQAQDFLDAYPEVAEIIDPDGDGLACEAYFRVDR